MMLRNLKKFDSAPASGHLLAYTRREVIFRPYTSHTEVADLIGEDELLEIHMFDKDHEYRAITSESSRYPQGYVEHIAVFPFSVDESADSTNRICEDVYREDCVLEHGQGTLTVLNHLRYDENGMIEVDDYRLMMGGRCDG